jgi:transposase
VEAAARAYRTRDQSVGVTRDPRTPEHQTRACLVWCRKDSERPWPRRFQAPYTPEFRDEAVRLARTSGRPIREIANKLGVNDQTLRNWVYADGGDTRPAKEITSDDREQLARLRHRVNVLEHERDILKKAAAWFAKETASTP